MDRHFLIPATIAAAIHGGLLFGIRPAKSELTSTTGKKPPIITVIELIRDFTLEPPPPEEIEKVATQGSPDNARPTLDELPPVNPTALFAIEVPKTPTSMPDIPISTIPRGPVGIPSGVAEGTGFEKGTGLRITDLDRTPRTRSQTPPAYPFEAKKEGRDGTVNVEFTVDESGGVLSPRVLSSSDPVFNDSALRAIARWRFEPGKRDGRVVRFKMVVPIVFSLNAE